MGSIEGELKREVEDKYLQEIERLERTRRYILDKLPFIKH